MKTAIIMIQCPDHQGIVARVAGFVAEHGGNIIDSQQHTTDPEGGYFFMRLEFTLPEESGNVANVETEFAELTRSLDAEGNLFLTEPVLRTAVLCSKQDHCLLDLLYRHANGELPIDIVAVISNHTDARRSAEHYGIPFHHIEITPETKLEKEMALLELVKDTTDFLVLARYMQILSAGFLSAYGKDIINIHHSFLPSFKGASPYRQAYERGVKVIGATAHFATAGLDEGPIMTQLVEPVSHRDTVHDLMRKGRNLEKVALANAVLAYSEHRITRFKNRTIVFD